MRSSLATRDSSTTRSSISTRGTGASFLERRCRAFAEGSWRSAIIASIPTEMRMDFQAPLGEDITMVWRRNMVTQSALHPSWLAKGLADAFFRAAIHNRLLRLHRPFSASLLSLQTA